MRSVQVLPQHRLVEAEAPLKELLGYSTLFRSLTRGSGSFTMEFLRYGAYPFTPLGLFESLTVYHAIMWMDAPQAI